MILGLSTYIRIWGLDQDPDVASGFANGKVLFVGSACKSICKCKSSFQTDQRVVFFTSSKNPWAKQNADGMYMWHFYGLLATCSRIYIVYIQSMAEDRMQWHILRGSEASCCNLGDKQKLIQASLFFPSRNDVERTHSASTVILWCTSFILPDSFHLSKTKNPFLTCFLFWAHVPPADPRPKDPDHECSSPLMLSVEVSKSFRFLLSCPLMMIMMMVTVAVVVVADNL